MTINVAGLLPTRRTPGAYFQVILGGKGTSAGVQPVRLLIAGNKITTALTGSAPNFSVAAGTQADAAPIRIYSADEAATYFGSGSELHRMALVVFAQFPSVELWAVSTAEAGTLASAVCTFVANATDAFTVRVMCRDSVIDVPVASGDTPTVIATAVANAILDRNDLPFTAQFALGVLTITAKHLGPRGNTLAFAMYFVPSSGLPIKITTSSTSSGAGTTATLSAVAALGGVYTLSGGATQDNATNALNAIAGITFHRQAWAHLDSTNGPLIAAQVLSRASIPAQRRQQVVFGATSSVSGVVGIATTILNNPRVQLAWHYASITPPEEIAAQVAAARLAGDAALGGEQLGEIAYPAANLDGMLLATIKQQLDVADLPEDNEVEAALAGGVTPLVPADGQRVCIARSVTTRTLYLGEPNYGVDDTCKVTVPDYCADDSRAQFNVDFKAKKLIPEPEDGEEIENNNLVHKGIVRAWFKDRLKFYERQGIIVKVDEHDDELVIEENAQVEGRLDGEIPTVPTPDFHQFGGNVRQLSSLSR